MTYPNILVFVDFPTTDVNAARRTTPRSSTGKSRIASRTRSPDRPGQNFLKGDGTQSEIGNLHMGVSHAANARPHPDPNPTEPTHMNPAGAPPGRGSW